MYFPEFLMNEYFLMSAFFILAFTIFIPLIYKTYTRWKQTSKPKDLANFLISSWITLYAIIPSYLILIRDNKKLRLVLPSEGYRLANLGFLVVAFFLIPKTLSLFQTFRKSQATIDFSLMTLFATISFFASL